MATSEKKHFCVTWGDSCGERTTYHGSHTRRESRGLVGSFSMVRATLSLLTAVGGIIVMAGCAAPCGVIGPSPCGPLLPGSVISTFSVNYCDAEVPCEQPACEPCGEISPATTCCQPIPAWGPLSPLFAIFCWGYPDTGCGELYLGDWPLRPRGCEPCDHFGNWVGPWAKMEATGSYFATSAPATPELASNPTTTTGGCAVCQHRTAAGQNGLRSAATCANYPAPSSFARRISLLPSETSTRSSGKIVAHRSPGLSSGALSTQRRSAAIATRPEVTITRPIQR